MCTRPVSPEAREAKEPDREDPRQLVYETGEKGPLVPDLGLQRSKSAQDPRPFGQQLKVACG